MKERKENLGEGDQEIDTIRDRVRHKNRDAEKDVSQRQRDRKMQEGETWN